MPSSASAHRKFNRSSDVSKLAMRPEPIVAPEPVHYDDPRWTAFRLRKTAGEDLNAHAHAQSPESGSLSSVVNIQALDPSNAASGVPRRAGQSLVTYSLQSLTVYIAWTARMAGVFHQRLRHDAQSDNPVQVRTRGSALSSHIGSMLLMALPVNRFDDGYGNLATFQSSEESFSIYRRYSYLQARLLLQKQDDLHVLERELDNFDDADPIRHTTKLGPDQLLPRNALLKEIEDAFLSYGIQCTSRPRAEQLWLLTRIQQISSVPRDC